MAYIDQILFKLAVYKGYCNIYSSYYVTEQAKQQIANELSGNKPKIIEKKVDLTIK